MIVFFVGTAAELVKMAPVIRETKRRGRAFTVVASGQNDLRGSELWSLANVHGADVTLSTERIPPHALGLASFLARTGATATSKLRNALGGVSPARAKAVVHGDTVSTLLGSLLFHRLGVPVHHVEAGLRSFDPLEPFPEEICRVLVSRLASVAYCPNVWASGHLHRHGLRKVLTHGNTLYDSLALALATEDVAAPAVPFDERFFVLVVHRQENLLRGMFLRRIVEKVRAVRERPRCVFIMHALTKAALEREGLLGELERDPSFLLLPRQPYIAFSKLLARADYLVTDGGSNQEEAYYLGLPCLLMRKVTERIEGLGSNVLLSRDPVTEIEPFMRVPSRWARPCVRLSESPSAIVADDLADGRRQDAVHPEWAAAEGLARP
ncbi:UDP-N-acetylglucosamine 2-epimerase [Labilithrix luteola]|uniref:UDP-N-acetylglucosamine 2-epimerase n=1 Tax=Labilithrix luteola TaxID=1391654 RepID=A0A0K1QBG9_9BACT|nr:UDP-N-acetylglucosamine 2-epimerase [Labilithrix luteola]AKV03094.1 UDP-N-acetylglucosamine 2-epimerase [Labilithrix luteola]